MKPDLGLNDIQGLDPISWWPLAPGWWAVLAVFLCAGLVLAWISYRRQRSWQREIRACLDSLAKNLSAETAQVTAVELSSLIRRLAIQRFSREECAALRGEAWLNWLSEKDPRKFDWRASAHDWIEAPFRPVGTSFDPQTLRQSIEAAKAWVKS